MPIPPLTHHEIVGLIEPFARRGRSVDLPASDRLARRLVFKTIEHAAGSDVDLARRETLELDAARPGVFRLTRTLAPVEGPPATLSVDGNDLAALLARIDDLPHRRQLQRAAGVPIALDLRIDERGTLRFLGGRSYVEGVALRMTLPTPNSRRVDVVLTTTLDDPIALPEDLLGVLGWDWSRLDRWTDRSAHRWTGSVGLRRRRADADAEAKLERAALHVATTLAEPPSGFDRRFRVARWIFALRRSIPLLVCVALIAASFAFTKTALAHDSVYRMLIFNAPPLLLVGFFCLREMPRIEWPRWPRRFRAMAWRGGDVEALPSNTVRRTLETGA